MKPVGIPKDGKAVAHIRIPLRWKIGSILTVTVISVMAAFMYVQYNRDRERIISHAIQHHLEFSEVIANQIRAHAEHHPSSELLREMDALLNGGGASLNLQGGAVLADSSVGAETPPRRYVFALLDRKGRLLGSNMQSHGAHRFDHPSIRRVLEGESRFDIGTMEYNGEVYLGTTYLVDREAPDRPAVHLMQPLARLTEQVSKPLNRNIVNLGILTMILLVVVIALTTRFVVRPVAALVKRMEQVREGNLDVTLETPRSRDEIGFLAASFNDMVSQLRRGMEALKRANDQNRRLTEDLEDKVRERTRELEKSEERYRMLAFQDPLTSLPNRKLFYDRLRQTLEHAKRHDEIFALMFLDIDRFKNINDTLGHSAGDDLLRQVGARLEGLLRKTDTIARLGGDEFTIILADVKKTELPAKVAQRVLETLSKPFHLGGYEMLVTGSIGISVYPTDGSDIETLMKNADIAMYRAKGEGKDNYQFHNRKIASKAFERAVLENNIRKAIDNRELELAYQPQISLATNEVTGFEALLRWKRPDIGSVLPDLFIPIAEDVGFIREIGEWVFQRVCDQLREWKEEGVSFSGRVTLNLSPRQFVDRRLGRKILGAVEKAGVEPASLGLEITESCAMDSDKHTLTTLQELKEAGMEILVDDFGTGYSCLSYLDKLPISVLKMDRSFVKRIGGAGGCPEMVGAIVRLAHSLGLRIMAEGVETREQVEFLRAAKCDEVQGFYFCKPLAADQVREFLAARSYDLAASL